MTKNPVTTIRALLERGFRAPRPGSNAMPLLELRAADGRMPGEEVDRWVRDGLLTAEPVDGEPEVMRGGNAGPYGEIPDVEMTHRYRLTEAGRRRLARG